MFFFLRKISKTLWQTRSDSKYESLREDTNFLFVCTNYRRKNVIFRQEFFSKKIKFFQKFDKGLSSLNPSSSKWDLVHQNRSRIISVQIVDVNHYKIRGWQTSIKEILFKSKACLNVDGKMESFFLYRFYYFLFFNLAIVGVYIKGTMSDDIRWDTYLE